MEYFGVATGLLYLFLEIKQHRAMWVVGFLTSFVYVFVFFFSKIYADMGLNLYYVLISIYGFWQWTRQRIAPHPSSAPGKKPIEIKTAGLSDGQATEKATGTKVSAGPTDIPAPPDVILYRQVTARSAAGIGCVLVALYGVLYFILTRYTDSPIPVGDAFTTAVGIVATWMLARRMIEHWLLWIVVNFVSAYLYYLRGLYPTLFLYLCYAVLAAVGLYNWKKKGIKTNDSIL